ncbi:MAG TPA: LytTR family DNA-binding domain-containing protein [Panacibacter sp.]|nr:LytTR family DNA-binding domain-containing protein [Panacibacter sp.]HNP44798.1 LytTR family DNA-binding domain-containing protein [Panacibacter sp.]
MTRAIIIDDEQHCIDRLSKLLNESASTGLELLGYFKTAEDGISGIQKLQPDLVFLDVQINDKTGFDLLQQLSSVNFEVIFTTAFERYAVQAFKFSALDYLLKPVDADDLAAALQKLKEKISVKESNARFDTLFHNLKSIQGISKRICVPVTTGLVFLQVSDIVRCQSDINYTTIFTKDKQKLVVAKTLKEFEEMLSDFDFYRVHNSHLINLAFIKSYNKGKGGFVTMTDNTDIEVSTRRKDDFLKRLSGM